MPDYTVGDNDAGPNVIEGEGRPLSVRLYIGEGLRASENGYTFLPGEEAAT